MAESSFPRSYTFTLTVTDSIGNTATSVQTVTVMGPSIPLVWDVLSDFPLGGGES